MFFKNFKNKLLLILLMTILIIPTVAEAYSESLIPGGENIGIEVKTNGVLALEIGFDQKEKVIKILYEENYKNVYSKKERLFYFYVSFSYYT